MKLRRFFSRTLYQVLGLQYKSVDLYVLDGIRILSFLYEAVGSVKLAFLYLSATLIKLRRFFSRTLYQVLGLQYKSVDLYVLVGIRILSF